MSLFQQLSIISNLSYGQLAFSKFGRYIDGITIALCHTEKCLKELVNQLAESSHVTRKSA